MSQLVLPPKLINFLKLHKCYKAFLRNYKLHQFPQFPPNVYSDTIKHHPYRAIGCAFSWGSTPEPRDYWSRLSSEWMAYCKLHNYQASNNKTLEL